MSTDNWKYLIKYDGANGNESEIRGRDIVSTIDRIARHLGVDSSDVYAEFHAGRLVRTIACEYRTDAYTIL